jgi:hypothetical protein
MYSLHNFCCSSHFPSHICPLPPPLLQDDASRLTNWFLSSAEKNSWWSWNKEQRTRQRNTTGKQLGRSLKAVLLTLYNLIPTGFLVLAIMARLTTEKLPGVLPDEWEERVEQAAKGILYGVLLGRGRGPLCMVKVGFSEAGTRRGFHAG